jgi:cell division septum initiation protein DivIVA
MPRGAKLDAGLREEIANAYLSDESVTVEALAKKYCLSTTTIHRIIKEYTKSGKGIKPDRRKKLTDEELDRQHAERMAEKAKAEHPRTSDWMDHITPLHQRKMELENAVEHKQVELDKARQEYRDFLATLRQLMEENV